MITTLQVLTVAFAVLAAIIHVLIFSLESVLWSTPKVWRRFGLKSQSDADVMEGMAFNQGFYNLFLALSAVLGLLLLGWGNPIAGKWVLLVSLASMVLASIVLLISERKLWRAALIQGVVPLLGIGALLGAVAVHAPLTVI
jgi:putative membrane protein